MSEYSLIGQRLPRIDSAAKVTGEAVFTADLFLPRMMHLKVVRSPHAHARILNIDVSRAKKVPGVIDIVTGKDTSGVKWGVFAYTRDQELIPTERVRYVGDEVAAVAAESPEAAEEAVRLIDVDYEILPAVFDLDAALAEGAPQLHEDYPGNLNVHVPILVGDLEAEFKKCKVIREDTFTATEESYFMAEPLAIVANADSQGHVETWFPNAAPHQKAKALSNALGLPMNKIHVRKVAQGGAFGGRSDVFPGEFITCLMAYRNKRPAKLVYSREENTIATRQAHGMRVHIRTGVDSNGLVLARDITAHMDGGAYSSTGPIATSVPFLCHEQTYKMTAVRYNGFRVYTNKPIRGMYRCHGRAWATGIDTQLDKLAEELGKDPVEVRLLNSREPNEYTPTKSLVQSCGLRECITQATAKAGWADKFGKMPKWRGIGLGTNSVQTGFPLGIRGGSQAFIKFNEDGGVTVNSGAVDNGQGNDMMLVTIVAEQLGLKIEDVELISADTQMTANDPGAYSMQATFTAGNAVRLAAEDARRQLFEVAAEKLEANIDDLVAEKGQIFVKGSPDAGLPIAKVVRLALIQSRPIMGQGHFAPKVDHRREWVKRPEGQLSETFSFGGDRGRGRGRPGDGHGQGLERGRRPGLRLRPQPDDRRGPVRGQRGHGRPGRHAHRGAQIFRGPRPQPVHAGVQGPPGRGHAADHADHRRDPGPDRALRGQGSGHVHRHVRRPGLCRGGHQRHRGVVQGLPPHPGPGLEGHPGQRGGRGGPGLKEQKADSDRGGRVHVLLSRSAPETPDRRNYSCVH